MRNVVGQTPRGADFFPRNAIINKIYRRLEAGANIFMAAPRRVGKTSIMRAMEDTPREGFHFVYIITEFIHDVEDYYHKLLTGLLNSEAISKLAKKKESIRNLISDVAGNIHIKIAWLELGIQKEGERHSYQVSFEKLLAQLDTGEDTIVIMIDEFPQTVENIREKHGARIAELFLRLNREQRQKSNSRIRFILTGSIGLPAVVKKLTSTSVINDLNVVEIPPLSEEEAQKLATQMTTLRNVASIYNPDLLSKAQLIDSFVIRNKKFEKLFADIKTSTMDKPEQPIIIVGLRGMVKTTLLRRLAYEVENDQGLHAWLMPIIFNEEEYGITKLFKLWETVAEYVEKRDSAFEGLYDQMDEMYRKLKGDAHQYEQAAFDILIGALHGRGKKLLLFIDNFGDMFRRFSKQEKQRLREILMTCSDLRIIAASAVIIEAFFKYDDPLFEFFKTERLDGLNSEETITLLLKLGEDLPGNPVKEILEKQPKRVEALRRLTGGIPRSNVLFFEIFVNDKDGDAFTDLESVLDRVTPLYKHRMDDLPAQQQEILQVLALNYNSMNTREIAERTRLDSKLVSAQLKQLQQNNLVSIVHTGGKNHIYHVHDRFFNIWFLMRMARKGDKNRVLWLVRFLECWCAPEQLSKRSEAHRKALSEGHYDPKSAYFMSTALHYANQEDTYPEFMKYFPLLLAKKQFDSLYNYFTSEKGQAIRARDRFLPVWYALMYFLREQYPNEYLRMPPELKETVTEIIEQAREYAVAYQ